ncbi:MAG: hypothetical protein HOP12_10535 [Candidatus Eisenbacteria bacterium]|uniref:Polysaccharide export protein n=1 Tax=Eiseniibacteriota bacterium TaxID=2212470 RepID=A0A849SPM7_UNCEI|nr:hypothetical protein [Candidatus Eisenbacteria bacterium]
MNRRLATVCVWLAGVVLALTASTAHAEDYLLGAQDEISITVYLHPELERVTSIDANGNVTFPPVGEVKAAGLTPRQLGDRLAERLSTFLRQTTAVTVGVRQYVSRSVFVSGAVARPGRYGFERLPGVIEAIGQAGGALPGADLSRVQIVRVEGESRRTLTADVARTMRDGVLTGLPELKVGDTIVIPSGFGADPFAAPGAGSAVLGQVAKPGLYPVGDGIDLWNLLAIAGGLTGSGDLSNVRVLTREGDGMTAVRVDLKNVLTRGTRTPYKVREGDVVFVPTTTASGFGRAISGFGTVLGITRDVFQIVVLADILKDNKVSN